MARRTAQASAGDAQAAIRAAQESEEFEPAPSARRPAAARRAARRPGGGASEDALREKAAEIFGRDARSDAPGAKADEQIKIKRQASQDTADRLFREAKAAGDLPAKAKRAVADRNGGVRAIDSQGRTAKWLRRPSSKRGSVPVSAEEATAGEALGQVGDGVELNALPRIVRFAKSLFQRQVRVSELQLQLIWEGYKDAHPEARGRLEVERDTVRIIADDDEILSSTRVSMPRDWRKR